MPDFKLSAPVTSPSPASPAPARGNAAAADDAGAPAFGAVMAQAESSPTPQNEPAAASKKAQPAPEARGPRAGARKPSHAADADAKPDASKLLKDASAVAEPSAPDAGAQALEQVTQGLALAAPAAVAIAPAVALSPAGTPDANDESSALTATDGENARPSPRGRYAHAADAGTAAQAGRATPTELTARPSRDAALAAHDGKQVQDAQDLRDAPLALAGAPQGAARDRLSEDFQQRFERALTAATPARSDAGLVLPAAAPVGSGAAPAANPVAQIAVPTPVGAAAFTEDFSNRVALLTRGKLHSAELSLTPADLGPVSVSIEVRGTEATLVFSAAHAATRSAIEEALPRLREMLDAQGLQLAGARVGTQADHNRSRDGRPPARPPAAVAPIEGASALPATAPPATLRPARLIDVIA